MPAIQCLVSPTPMSVAGAGAGPQAGAEAGAEAEEGDSVAGVVDSAGVISLTDTPPTMAIHHINE